MEQKATRKKENRPPCGTGRRKSAIARVFLKKGKGEVFVNDKKYNEYFTLEVLQDLVQAPIKLGEKESFDYHVNVRGGGIHAQATAARLAIARTLVGEDESLRTPFKEKGFLTRDPRKRERKKYGLRGARRAFQFSKR